MLLLESLDPKAEGSLDSAAIGSNAIENRKICFFIQTKIMEEL
ncbi:hypothetical protein [Sulfurospirillum multivorans]|nr:hypothetical protein [Sulfurospirillum multivorans]